MTKNKNKFKVGDRVKYETEKKPSESAIIWISETVTTFGTVIKAGKTLLTNNSSITVEFDDGVIKKFNGKEIEKSIEKIYTIEEGSKYMVYGTGCNNKTPWFDTETEAIEEARKLACDNNWTGEILVMEIKPTRKIINSTYVLTVSE